MEHKETKKKIWIKNTAIVFLAILLILTFFSNTIRNYSLTEVSTERVLSGELSLAVRATGTVLATGTKTVTADKAYVIDEIFVKEGDKINKGDVLLSFSGEQAVDLNSLNEQLELEENTYQQLVLHSGLTLDEVNQYEQGTRISLYTFMENIDVLRTEQEELKAQIQSIDTALIELNRQLSELNMTDNDTTSVNKAINEYTASRESCYLSLTNKTEELNNAITHAEQSLQVMDALDKITDLKNEIAMAEADNEKYELISEYDGTIKSIEAGLGQTSTPGQELFVIIPSEHDYTLTASVTREQAAQLVVGDTAKTSGYWGSDNVEAIVESIFPDVENPANMCLRFRLKGDLIDGLKLTLVVNGKTEHYDMLVENSSIFKDSNGSFVWVINTESDTLGNRYSVERVAVNVVAIGENTSAIVGDLSDNSYIVTSATAPISDGEQVRLSGQ